MSSYIKRHALKENMADKIFSFVVISILLIVCIVVLYPLYFILIASITDPMVVNVGGFLLYPTDLYFKGYEEIFKYEPLWSGYLNSINYTLLGTFINLFVTIPATYALSRKDLCGRKFFMMIFAFTMFFSGGLIPSYIINSNLGLRDNIWAMVLPTALNVWNLIIARTFFDSSIPKDMLEAAQLDGANDFRFFFAFALPLSKALVAVITLFYAVGHWNSYFHAMIYLNEESMFPLQLILRNLLLINQVTASSMTADMRTLADKIRIAEQLKYGIIIVSSLPLLVLYPFLQRYFVQGVLVGSLKE